VKIFGKPFTLLTLSALFWWARLKSLGVNGQKINHNWNTIRNHLRTMVRLTTTLVTEEGKTIYLRQTSELEPMHIFSALGISQKPLKRVVKVS